MSSENRDFFRSTPTDSQEARETGPSAVSKDVIAESEVDELYSDIVADEKAGKISEIKERMREVKKVYLRAQEGTILYCIDPEKRDPLRLKVIDNEGKTSPAITIGDIISDGNFTDEDIIKVNCSIYLNESDDPYHPEQIFVISPEQK